MGGKTVSLRMIGQTAACKLWNVRTMQLVQKYVYLNIYIFQLVMAIN